MALLPSIRHTRVAARCARRVTTFYAAWSNFIATGLAEFGQATTAELLRFRQRRSQRRGDQDSHNVIGFPRDVLLPGNRDNKPAAYVAADADVAFRDPQNEYYFEWYVNRNNAGKITKLTFVTETPEYYRGCGTPTPVWS
jgi:hypothetical protein